MSYLEDMRPYLDERGLASNERALHSDNPFLYQATHISVLDHLGLGLFDAVSDFLDYLNARKSAGNGRLPLPEVSWGHGNLSHDEVNGIASVVPREAVAPLWIFNATGNLLDYVRGWYWRCLYLVPFIKVMNGVEPSWLEQQLYAFHVRRVMKSQHFSTSSRCLLALQAQHKRRFPKVMGLAMHEFCEHINEDYGGLHGLYYIYFGPKHPFTVHTTGVSL